MKVRIKYYAGLREKIGKNDDFLDLPNKIKVKDVRERIAKFYGLDENIILVAVNGSFANPEKIINKGDEVVIFPPVSGG